MVGKHKAYKHQSMFWSDLGPKIGYEAVGLVDSQLSTVSVWAKASEADTPAAAVSQHENLRGVDVQDIKASSDAAPVQSNKQPGNPAEGTVFSDEKFGKGLVFYMKNKKVVGVLLFNVFGKVQEARDVIANGTPVDQIEKVVSK
jgi:programmed cell death 8 (apoptosis-inducing factor)